MKAFPEINHCLYVGLPGSYKDICCVRVCHEGFLEGKKIFSNQSLTFESKQILKVKDMVGLKGDNWNPSIFYIHDIGNVFSSHDYSDKTKKAENRSIALNNYRKRGIQILGSCHRENEVHIDIRVGAISYFIYPSCVKPGNTDIMEDMIIVLEWYDKPDHDSDLDKPIFKEYFLDPSRYARMYNTLEECNIN